MWGDIIVENEILELLKVMQSSINELKEGQTRIENRLYGIELDIKDIKLDTGSIKINIKETREDARSAELATAQNSSEIAQIKMRMKMA